jgi:hypothetical protein
VSFFHQNLLVIQYKIYACLNLSVIAEAGVFIMWRRAQGARIRQIINYVAQGAKKNQKYFVLSLRLEPYALCLSFYFSLRPVPYAPILLC